MEKISLGTIEEHTMGTDEWFDYLKYVPATDSFVVDSVYFPGQYSTSSMSFSESSAADVFKPGSGTRSKAIKLLKEHIAANGPYKEQFEKHLAKIEAVTS